MYARRSPAPPLLRSTALVTAAPCRASSHRATPLHPPTASISPRLLCTDFFPFLWHRRLLLCAARVSTLRRGYVSTDAPRHARLPITPEPERTTSTIGNEHFASDFKHFCRSIQRTNFLARARLLERSTRISLAARTADRVADVDAG